MRSKEVRLTLSALALAGMFGFVYAFWPSTRAVPSPEDAALVAPQPAEPLDVDPPVPADAAPAPAPRDEPRPSADRNLATLEIESPHKARVFLDGRTLGTAPGTFTKLSPGEHLVALDAGAGKREERTVVITAGSIHRIRFDFAETGGQPTPKPRSAPTSVAHVAEKAGDDAPPPEIRRWTGYLTDEDCGATGGAQGTLHFRCAERCIHEGKAPMLYSRGKLYRLEGFERIELFRDQPLQFRGFLEGDTIHVVAPDAED
jgi:hypothetical protein